MCAYDSQKVNQVHRLLVRNTQVRETWTPEELWDYINESANNSHDKEGLTFNEFDWCIKTLCGWNHVKRIEGLGSYPKSKQREKNSSETPLPEWRYFLTPEGLGFAKQHWG